MPGPWEWVLIFIIALLLLGPGIFMRAGGSLGSGVGAFKRALKEGEQKASGQSQNEPPAS